MNNRHTRLNSILSNINNFKFALAVGHGQHEPSLPPVLVPKDTYVIFTSKPGYLSDTSDVHNQKFKSIFQNRNKVKKLLLGTLSREEKPKLLTNKNWDWKKHIYPPESLIANHSLEFYDSPQPGNTRNEAYGKIVYDTLCGLWKIGIPDARQFHGSKQNLQTILNTARSSQTGKLIVFISGCRGDPAVSEESLRQAMSFVPSSFKRYFEVPQTYNITLTNYLRKIRNFESEVSRIMRLKRTAGASSVSNGSSLNLNLNLNTGNLNVLNKYRKMIARIKEPTFGVRGNKQLPIQAARTYFPYFFTRNMTNENARLLINSIKRSNTNLSNRITNLWKFGQPIDQNWKNHINVAKRIVYKIKNIENRNNSASRQAARH